MKIFILNPFLFTGKLSKLSRKRQPLELAYIASLLRNSHQVKLLDANALNMSLDETIKEIKDFGPDVLILTSTPIDRWEVPSHAHIKFLIKNIIKTINSVEISYVILLGSHGTVMPEWILERSKVNFVVRSEPEMTIVNLVNVLAEKGDISGIRGISYIKDGKIISNADAGRNKNLDDMPMPAYDLLPMDKYRYTFSDIPTPFSIMITSRGCPFNCTYCLKAMMPNLYITRSPENVIKEMEYLSREFGIKGIYFQDWEFLIDKNRVQEICRLIKENNLDIKWGCNARAADINDEIVEIMKDSGCVRINIGFETGSQKLLDMAKKGIKISEIKNAIEVCRRYAINIGIYSILNLPGEDKKTIAETEKFLADNNLKTMCAPNLPIPYFGTELYEMLKKQEGRGFDWENLDKYAGKVGVKQSPWLAQIYRWHYKYKFTMGKWYFLMPKFYLNFIKKIKSKIL